MQFFKDIAKAVGGKPKNLKQLFDKGLLTVAKQPKNNALDLKSLGASKLYLFPIDHDYPGGSAAMHNAVFSHFGLARRAAFVVGNPANVEAIFGALKNDPLYDGGGAGSGFKDKVAPYLDRLDASAKAIGSVNVIAREDGALVGYNTDGIGFVLGLLNEYPDCIEGRKIVILGAGGTALPISYELARKRPAEIVIANRTVDKAEKISRLVSQFCKARAVGEDAIGAEFVTAGIVVNTSNKGAQPNEKFSAFAPMTGDANADMAVAKANLEKLPKNAIVADILLEPTTLTLEMAKKNGNPTHSGRHMNLFQAVPAFRIMTKMRDENLQAIMKGALK
jgi:shikimate dehydrogenase